MKKIFAIVISLLLVLMVGCGNQNNEPTNEEDNSEENTASQVVNSNDSDGEEEPADGEDDATQQNDTDGAETSGNKEENQGDEQTHENTANTPDDAIWVVQERLGDHVEINHIAGGDVEKNGNYFFRITATDEDATEIFFVEKGTGHIFYSMFDEETGELVPDLASRL